MFMFFIVKLKMMMKKSEGLYYYFNSTFIEHKIILSQVFSSFRWEETVANVMIEKVNEKDLDWTVIIYLNRFTIHIARLFALCMEKKWYKIQKVKVLNNN